MVGAAPYVRLMEGEVGIYIKQSIYICIYIIFLINSFFDIKKYLFFISDNHFLYQKIIFWYQELNFWYQKIILWYKTISTIFLMPEN